MSERIFDHAAHMALWNWLSNNPEEDKINWPGWKHNGGVYSKVANYCFACEYAKHANRIECDECPVIWPKENKDCEEDIYNDWRSAIVRGSYQVASLLAEEIRDLPVKPGVKCK